MTPDTFDYFIAGYVVIILGIVGYILSLVIRSVNLKRKLNQQSKVDTRQE